MKENSKAQVSEKADDISTDVEEAVIKPIEDKKTVSDSVKDLVTSQESKFITNNTTLNPDVENIKNVISDVDSLDVEELDKTTEINLEDISKATINVDKDSVVVNDKVVTDDEYFDDFFE